MHLHTATEPRIATFNARRYIMPNHSSRQRMATKCLHKCNISHNTIFGVFRVNSLRKMLTKEISNHFDGTKLDIRTAYIGSYAILQRET